MPAGALAPVTQVWALSQHWYGNRMRPDFQGWTIDDAHQIFEKVGLRGLFWRMDGAAPVSRG